MKRWRQILVTMGALVSLTVPARAATLTAASCNRSDVNAVINGPTHVAVDGDTIVIPAGTCTWSTAGIATGKAISIVGAGEGLTVLNDAIPFQAAPCSLFSFTPSVVDSLTRVSGMTLQPATGVTSACRAIEAQGTCALTGCPNIRFDHITFSGWAGVTKVSNGYAITAIGDVFGVFDHNTINGTVGNYLQLVQLSHAKYQGIGSYGDNAWHQPENYGSRDFLFIENNTFNSAGTTENEANIGGYVNQGGGRVVVRYNQFIVADGLNFSMGWHGTETGGRPRSTRTFEFYGNAFQCNGSCGAVLGLRGGTGLAWGNVVNLVSGALNGFMTLDTYRTQANIGDWGACDGSSPYDQNDGVVYWSGTVASGGGTPTMTVSGTNPGWSADQWLPNGAPYSVHNVTKNTGSEITANGANTLTVAYGGGPGSWLPANGDAIQILRASYCIDQAGGRGAGILYSPTWPATPAASPNEVASPTYVWSNSFIGRNPVFNSNASGVGANTRRVIRGRDYHVESTNQQAQSSVSAPFDGTTLLGVGHGTLANRPATCTPGVGYWATDRGEWNSANSGPDGQFFTCTTGQTWALTYTPYAYPHPLAAGQPPTGSPCDVNGDGTTNVVDMQLLVNQALGITACTTDLNSDGLCNVVDIQRVINAALGGACVTQ